jgi:hypothetical protein
VTNGPVNPFVMKVLVLSGSMGAGKSTVMGEATELLKAHGILHGVAELDCLSAGHDVESAQDDLMLRNQASVWEQAAGPSRVGRGLPAKSRPDLYQLGPPPRPAAAAPGRRRARPPPRPRRCLGRLSQGWLDRLWQP